jgi:hypothetical protein
MRCKLFGLLLLVVSSPRQLLAEGGEFVASMDMGHEVALLQHPTQQSSGALYLPRLGLTIGYGLAHWLDLTCGADVSLPRDFVGTHQEADGGKSELFATHMDVAIPAGLRLRWANGEDWAAALHLMVGLGAAFWGETSAVYVAPHGLRARVPGSLEPTWHLQPLARVVATATWRPLDWFSIEMGPYATWTPTSRHLGLHVEAQLLAGAGPSF